MTIPFFDGHNDTLLRLLEAEGADKERPFIEGSSAGHIDLPRAKAGGMAGGFFAMFPPPLKGSPGAVSAAGTPDSAGKLPPMLDWAEAQRSTTGMASILFRLERAGALAVCRNAAELRAALPEPEPGAAARKLLELGARLPRPRGRRTDVSRHVKEHLYGRDAGGD